MEYTNVRHKKLLQEPKSCYNFRHPKRKKRKIIAYERFVNISGTDFFFVEKKFKKKIFKNINYLVSPEKQRI